ncbi:MAG TPA: 3'-5' exonuclease, partial [Bdellovibrionales bacterium]|nr:3'-5' exonuclease [Bdellovibrionales bacterium]
TAAQFDPLAKAFVAEFRRLKRTEGVLSMGDLELVALRGIRIHPETARNFAAEWDFWLIDEFQDTSPLQNKILLELIGESAYFVVGDPQQSIYLFRGARSEVFQGQRQRIASLEGELHALTANYRSTPQIVHFFNEFFTALSPSFKPMEPKGEQRSKLEAPIVFFKANDAETEAAGIVNHVKSLLAGGAAPESICVLGRTNDVLVRLAAKLYEARVPVFVHSNSGFAERREVQDAVALLKFLANPHDNKNLIQLLRSPWYRVSDADLVSNLTGAPVSYWDQLREKQWPALTLLRALLGQSREVGLSHVFNEAIATHGLIDFSIHYDGSGRRESNIWKLAGRLKEAECEPDFNIVDFVAEYMADHAASEFSDEGDAVAALEPQRVNLMTVHRSKGLQFRHVIIPDMNRKPGTQGSVPFLVDEARQVWMLPVQIGEDSTRTHSHLGKLTLRRRRELEAEESDRVLYVAMTRAVESLFMSWSGVPKKDSWVQRMKWDLTTGRHQREHYLYEVRDRIDEVSNYVPLVQKASVPRTPYKSALEVRRTQSVTELLKSQEFGDNSLARSQARLKKSLDGVLIHELFEAMRYTRELPLEVLRTRFGERAEHIQRAIEFVRGLREVPMGELLKSGHAEWGFLLSEKGHNLPGRIDLWGESGGTAWIIDYKTGDPDRTPSAFDQLSIYSLALRRFGVKAPIKLAVIYPLSEYVSVRPAPEEQWVLERFFVAIKKGTSG